MLLEVFKYYISTLQKCREALLKILWMLINQIKIYYVRFNINNIEISINLFSILL